MVLEHIFSTSHILFAVWTGELGLSTVILGHMFGNSIWIVRHKMAAIFTSCAFLCTTFAIVQAQVFGPVVPPHYSLIISFIWAMPLLPCGAGLQQPPAPVIPMSVLIFGMHSQCMSILCNKTTYALVLLDVCGVKVLIRFESWRIFCFWSSALGSAAATGVAFFLLGSGGWHRCRSDRSLFSLPFIPLYNHDIMWCD